MKTKSIVYGSLIVLFCLGSLPVFCKSSTSDPPKGQTAHTAQPDDLKKKDIRVTQPASQALKIDIWTDREDGVYKPGQFMTISYQAKRDCYFSLFRINNDLTAERIFPTPEKTFNFLEAERIYTLKINAGRQTGAFILKAVVTLDPSNAVQPGVKFKSGSLNIGPMRVIPLAQSILFADWELTRFFYLPRDRYAQKQINYTVKP